MSRKPLTQLWLTAPAAAAEPLAALWERVVGEYPVAYRREGTDTVELSCYVDRLPRPLAELRSEFAAGAAELARAGVPAPLGPLALRRVPREDWAESWKKHFPPLEIGGHLLLKPSWSPRRPKPGQVELVLDPGLSFGTGHHPTTAFCLRQVVKYRPGEAPRSLLDMGMGTGILAIAAVKLGYEPVWGFDFDPESVRVARENAALNGVLDRLRLTRQDLTRLPLNSRGQYDVVCANLEYPLLMRETTRILNRVKAGGVLVLAGILETQFASLRAAYEDAGMTLLASRGQGDWRSGAFRKP